MTTIPRHHSYILHVCQRDEGTYLAYLGDYPMPLAGHGTTPLEAVRALCETIREWPLGGSERWLATPDGAALRKAMLE